MDAFTKLRKLFPGVNQETKLFFLSPSTRIRIGKETIELAPYELGDGSYIHAAFVPARNHIYVRLLDIEWVQGDSPKTTDKKEEKITNKKEKTNKKD